MAGTMPHAVLVETDVDGSGLVAAYAAELPGCATFAQTDEEAVAAMPRRAAAFAAWLGQLGEQAPTFVGDNWYEVERSASTSAGGERRRATFSLDDLPPGDDEFARYLRWLELAREELAGAIDRAGPDARVEEVARTLARQDAALVWELGGQSPALDGDPVDRLYEARDALTDVLQAAGPSAVGVRRVLRLGIADDLRAAEQLRGGG